MGVIQNRMTGLESVCRAFDGESVSLDIDGAVDKLGNDTLSGHGLDDDEQFGVTTEGPECSNGF